MRQSFGLAGAIAGGIRRAGAFGQPAFAPLPCALRNAAPDARRHLTAGRIHVPEGGIRLRYFDSRGRAQALRYALIDAGVEFEDDRISLQHVASGNWWENVQRALCQFVT
jgi:hypothetical protein